MNQRNYGPTNRVQPTYGDVNTLAQIGRWAGIGQSVDAVFSDLFDLLAAIQGRCAMAARLTQVGDGDLEATAALASRGAGILQDVMAFARGDDTRWTCSVRSVSEKVASFLSLHRLSETPVRFQIEDDTRVACTPTQLQQVLQTLILYILEFVGDGEGGVDVRCTAHAKEATIAISHAGPGISGPLRERMFEPFASPKDAGAGLSLFIARAIVNAHGGFLAFFSTPERGTTFHVVLPLVEDERAALSPRPPHLRA